MRYSDSFIDKELPSETEVLNYVNEKKKQGEDAYKKFWERTRGWYNVYRGITTSMFGAERHNVSIPILFSQIVSDVANKCQTLFSDEDIIGFVPNNRQDAPLARKNTKLLNQQLIEARTYEKAVDFFLSAAIYGTGILRLYYTFTEETRLLRTRVLDQQIVVRDKQVTFDGPDWQVVDIMDFIPEPGKKRLQDCNWIIHTYYLELDDLLEMQMGEGQPMFDPEGVQRLLESPMGVDQTESWKLRTNTYRNLAEQQFKQQQNYSRPVRIDEYWGKVPHEFAINGDRNVVISVANSKTVLRYEPNPFWDHRLPFLVYTPMPDIHAFHGTGKCEIAEKIQGMINKLANIKMDVLELFARPTFFASNNSGLDNQTLTVRPGKLWQVAGEKVSDTIMPVSPDLRAMQMVYTEMEQMAQFQQQGLGIPADGVQGMPGPERETARGALMRQGAAMNRLAAETVLAEHMVIVPMTTWMRNADRQWLTLPKELKLMGTDAVIDEQTGLPIPQQAESMDFDSLNMDFRIRAIGPTRLLGKEVKAGQLNAYAQAAATVPGVLQMTNWTSWITAYAKALDLSPSDLMIQQQIPQVNMGPEVMSGDAIGGQQMMSGIGMMGDSGVPINNLTGGSDAI